MAHLGTFVLTHWALVLALVIILTLLVMTMAKDRLLGFTEIKPVEAVQLINHQDAVVIDVREQEEYDGGHILNSILVPVGTLEARIADLEPYRAQPLIVYCRTGQRAARASSLLKKNGFANVSKLAGGVLAWETAGLPLAKP